MNVSALDVIGSDSVLARSLCGARTGSTADPPVGGLGMDRVRRRPCLDHAARGTAVARYEAIDWEKRRLGPAPLGYHNAICNRNRNQATRNCPRRVLTFGATKGP